MLILFRRNHGARLRVGELCLISWRLRFSTTSPSPVDVVNGGTQHHHFMVDYFIDSLGFSKSEALSVSKKVSHLKSSKNSELVINALRQYGLDKSQIKDIVSSVPQILLHRGTKTLEPKIKVLRELGLSGSDLVTLIKKHRRSLWMGLHSQFIPTIDYLRQIMGSDENAVRAINKTQWLLSPETLHRIPPNVILLQRYGLSDENIRKFVTDSKLVRRSPQWFEAKLHWVEQELGIPRDSPMFLHGLSISWLSKAAIEERFRAFRSFGWIDSEIVTLARKQPLCFRLSADKIHSGLNFFIKEIGYTPAQLVANPWLLGLSLEKRVKPRYQVLKILKKKKLVTDKPSLITLAQYSGSVFLKFLMRFEKKVPGLCESYTRSTMRYKSKTQNDLVSTRAEIV